MPVANSGDVAAPVLQRGWPLQAGAGPLLTAALTCSVW